MREVIVGTRQSKLALIQTNWVIDQLKANGIKNHFQIEEFVTKGDRILNKPLSKVGGSGIFIREIEQEMYDKKIDFAVHSMKDLPAKMPEGFIIASIPMREDPRDAYISRNNVKLKDLPKGAIIGTSSLRRSAQILTERPDIQAKWIRGTVDSRIEQLQNGDYAAIILAVAGLKRLGLDKEIITEYLPADRFVPAIGQGALAIQCREDDYELHDILAVINDEDAAKAVKTERLFIDLIENGDQAPIGGYAYVDNGTIHLHGTVVSADGKTILSKVAQGIDPIRVAQGVANDLIKQGAYKIIRDVKEEQGE